MDRVPKRVRSKIMRSVKSKNTGPEIIVKKIVFRLEYRYRVNFKYFPGKPDIVFTKKRKVIFVNGCFWHGHKCKKGMLPKTNISFWNSKIERNKKRDIEVKRKLRKMGWEIMTIWQCQLVKENRLQKRLIDFIEGNT